MEYVETPIRELTRYHEIKVIEPAGWGQITFVGEAIGHYARYNGRGWAWVIQFRMLDGPKMGLVLSVLVDPALKAIRRK